MTLPKTPSFRLDGKRALVSGASSGIGLGCAVALAEAGAHVVMTARGAERLQAAVDEAAREGLSVEAQVMDVADIDATAATLEGEVYDILVNSAGMSRPATAIDTPVEDYDAIMGANVRGAFFISRNVARGLIEAGRPGSIINVSSQMGHVGGVERAMQAAKAAGAERVVLTSSSLAVTAGRGRDRPDALGPEDWARPQDGRMNPYAASKTLAERHADLALMHEIPALLASMPQVVIAAVNGPAFGAGLAVALTCDVVLAAQGTRFGTAFLKQGLVSDFGLSYQLARLAGPAAARRVILTDQVLDAGEAQALGLVSAVHEPEALLPAAAQMAAQIAAWPASARAGMKALLRKAETATHAEMLAEEAALQGQMIVSDDHAIAVDDFNHRG